MKDVGMLPDDAAEPADAGRETVPSILTKAFDVLGAFSAESRVLTLTEISQRTGLPKPTVHRLLSRLEELDVVERHRTGWRVGVRLRGIAALTPVEALRSSALPHLAHLHSWSKQSVRLGIQRGTDVFVLEVLFSQNSDGMVEEVGTRLPIHDSALGRAILAFIPEEEFAEVLDTLSASVPEHDRELLRAELAETKRRTLAISRDRFQEGLGAIAAPVIIRGRAVASVSARFATGTGYSDALANAVQLTAARIARDTSAVLGRGRREWNPFLQ